MKLLIQIKSPSNYCTILLFINFSENDEKSSKDPFFWKYYELFNFERNFNFNTIMLIRETELSIKIHIEAEDS